MNPTDKYVGSRVRMRPLMLGMSQEALADQLGLHFNLKKKYEKGVNHIARVGYSRYVTSSKFPVQFFLTALRRSRVTLEKGAKAPLPAYISDFLATSDGLALVRAFMRIGDFELRRSIVRLVEEIVGDAVGR